MSPNLHIGCKLRSEKEGSWENGIPGNRPEERIGTKLIALPQRGPPPFSFCPGGLPWLLRHATGEGSVGGGLFGTIFQERLHFRLEEILNRLISRRLVFFIVWTTWGGCFLIPPIVRELAAWELKRKDVVLDIVSLYCTLLWNNSQWNILKFYFLLQITRKKQPKDRIFEQSYRINLWNLHNLQFKLK